MRLKVIHCLSLSMLLFSVEVFARAGGGSSGSGRGGRWTYLDIFEISLRWIVLIIGGAIITHYSIKKHKKIIRHMKRISLSEKHWDPKFLIMKTNEIFLLAQEMWSNHDLDGLKSILHPKLYEEWKKQLSDELTKFRKNRVFNVQIVDMEFIDLQNYLDDEQDCFTVWIEFTCHDIYYKHGVVIEEKLDEYCAELWTFEMENESWCLKSVCPGERHLKYLIRRIKDQKKSA